MQTDLFNYDGSCSHDPLRLEWRFLVETCLPKAASDRNWPIRLNHCFARILLDVVIGRPWRESVTPPAWRNAPLPIIAAAIELGEAVLCGTADLNDLNGRSLALRGKI